MGGHDTWFKLEPRSSTSKVQGECHLILKLFTNQVRGRRRGTPVGGGGGCVGERTANAFISAQRDTTLSRKDSSVSIHRKLLTQILEYEHGQVKVSSAAATVLTGNANLNHPDRAAAPSAASRGRQTPLN